MSTRSDSWPKWFRGAVDLHVHSRPSIFPRLLDDREVAGQAARAGMRAVVLKAHEGSTVERAELAQTALSGHESEQVPGEARQHLGVYLPEREPPPLIVLGGVVLNRFVGGLNANAVELALALGGRIVWMPTIHATNHVNYYGEAGFKEQRAGYRARPVRPLSVLDDGGKLLSEAVEVLEVVAAHPQAVLNNGHLGMKETAALFSEAKRRGIDRLMVAHPELPLMGYHLDFQIEMARLGAVIERCYLPHTERWGGFPVERTASEIRQIGVECCVLSTDFGQVDNPPPAEGLERFGSALIEKGLSEEEVARMIGRNPAALLGLDQA